MELAVEEFSSQINDAEVAFFYYSGHGVQRKGNNYLMPTRATINNAKQIRHRAMNISFLMDEMSVNTSGLSLVILDACRDDPYPWDSKSSSSRGLARMDAPSETIIAYATKPGSTAADGIGNHSPYTTELLNHLQTQSHQPIDNVLNKINVAVEDATDRKQSPRLELSPLRNVYCFAECVDTKTQRYPLYIKTRPADAIVRILNIGPKYQPGMLLKPGKYEVEVTKSGYPRHVSFFELTVENRVYYVELELIDTVIPHSIKPWMSKPGMIDPFAGMEFVDIKAGCFQMGSPESEVGRKKLFVSGDKDSSYIDEQQHRVCINKNFSLGKYEVTQAQYQKVMGNNPSGNQSFFSNTDNHPIENVNWFDVLEFIGKLNQKTGLTYRLPTEAEWEYATRAGTSTPFYTGMCINKKQANYDSNDDYNGCGLKTDNYRNQTVEVGQFPANPWGLYDLAGNVWEWTCSEHHGSYSDAGFEKKCIDKNQGEPVVLRGGSFYSSPVQLRSAARSFLFLRPLDRSDSFGFRLARTL